MITKQQIARAISFELYMKQTEQIAHGESNEQLYKDEKMLRYTQDNLERMNRIKRDITIDSKLYNEVQQITTPQTWICITEPWCGDASQIVPVLYLISLCNPLIDFKIILRDENLEVMDAYLTNGGRSIPKLVMQETETGKELGVWGPRPATLQEIVVAQKDDTTTSFGDKVRMIHAWYGENKTVAIQDEFLTMFKTWKANATQNN